VYVDVCGPHVVESASGNLYSLDILDDCTSFVWTYPIKKKSQAFDVLEEFTLRMERKLPYKFGTYRIDNGELKSKKFEKFCAARGISVEHTAPYTSAHNGRVERLHLTLVNKYRAMRSWSDLPDNRWDELLATAAYLHVRTVNSTSAKTPFELLYGRKPNLSHLREIGCRAFVLKQPQKANPKLYDRGYECVMIGYSPSSKAYRLYHRPSHKVIESFHVDFIESRDNVDIPLKPGEIIISTDTDSSFTPDDESPIPVESAPPTEPDPAPVVPDSRPKRKRVLTERAKAMMDTLPEDELDDVLAHFCDLDDDDLELELAYILESPDHLPAPSDPRTVSEALHGPNASQWKASIEEELQGFKDLGVYRLIPPSKLPPGRKLLKGKMVFRQKLDSEGRIARFKSRYVAMGNHQIPGKDYNRTTSPTARMESFRTLLDIAASNNWPAEQLDVKTAFLHGVLDEAEVQYMRQPKGFEEPGKEDWLWEVVKGIYGIKQAGRVWNKTLNEAMLSWGFTRLPCEWCVYFREDERGIVLVAIHVDDFLCVGSSTDAIRSFKEQIKTKFSISESDVDLCLGIKISRNFESRTIAISQPALIDHIISQFNQSDADSSPIPMSPDILPLLRRPNPSEKLSTEDSIALAKLPYRSLIGSLMYLSIGSRPDIAFSVSKLSQFLDCYRKVHWDAAIRVVRYLKGTRGFQLHLGGGSSLVGHSDSSWADDCDTRRSQMGYCFSLGAGVISWSSRRQPIVTQSSTEAEYIAASEASREAIWLRSLLAHLNRPISPVPINGKCDFDADATSIYCDNNGAITLAFDQAFHSRAKHIDVRYHYVREQVEAESITLNRIPSQNNVADIFTKPLGRVLFERHRLKLGVS
jgi:hypothetical protein